MKEGRWWVEEEEEEGGVLAMMLYIKPSPEVDINHVSDSDCSISTKTLLFS